MGRTYHEEYQAEQQAQHLDLLNDILTFNACSDTSYQAMNLLASRNVINFGAEYFHFRCGRQSAFPLASRSSLSHYAQSSVLVWWLAFDQAGLSSLLTSTFLALLIVLSPKNSGFFDR